MNAVLLSGAKINTRALELGLSVGMLLLHARLKLTDVPSWVPD